MKKQIAISDRLQDDALDAYAANLPNLRTQIVSWITDHRDRSGKLAVGAISLSMVEDLMAQAGFGKFLQIDAQLRALADDAVSLYADMPQGEQMLASSKSALAVAIHDTRADFLAQMSGVGNEFAVKLKNELAMMAVVPRSLNAIGAVIADAANTTQKKAVTIANTALAGVQRSLHATVLGEMSEEDDPHIWYQGPDDRVTRPFCAVLAGMAIRKQDMARLDNGTGLSVMQYGGGWNCRHRLIPVTADFVRRRGITVASQDDLKRAMGAAR